MAGWETVGAVGAAFAAGMLSFLSPCVMPLMPAYLSLISGLSVEEIQEAAAGSELRRRIVRSCMGFVAGFSTVFIALGASATAVGRVLRTWSVSVGGVELGIAQLAGLVIILMGLHIVGLLPIHLLYRDAHLRVESRRPSLAGAYMVGAAFAFGWSPCVGPILSGILAVAASRDTVLQGVGLLTVYSAGLAVPFLLTGWSLEYFFRIFGRVKRYFRALEVVSGGLLVAIGLLVLTDQLTRFNSYFVFLNRFVSALEQALL
jgi:cytochrome c-type biogenesis protein